MKPHRVTQGDVARRVGLDRSTVSMALRNHPNIPPRTRERIVRAAEKLGYVPDPMLAALAAYRSQKRQAAFRGTLAWLIDSNYGYDWRDRPHFVEYHQGALKRGRALGYRLKIFDLHSPQMTPARTAAILRARNISGILLCPQPQPDTILQFPWEFFSAVTFGYTLTKPQLHTVTATHYRAMLHTMRELSSLGYRRIGLALHEEHDRRTDHNYLAGYLVARQLDPRLETLPVLGAAYTDGPAVRTWLRRCRPDAVVTGSVLTLETLRDLGIAVPGQVGLACPVLPWGESRAAGVMENNPRIGAVAADFLVSMIQRGERGVPGTAERIHVEGRWQDGATTVRPRAAAGPRV